MQDYNSAHAAVVICAPWLTHTETGIQLLPVNNGTKWEWEGMGMKNPFLQISSCKMGLVA